MSEERPAWGAPQTYSAVWQPAILGGDGQWSVIMNNWKHITNAADQASAEREAARRNFAEGCYPRPAILGM